MKKKSFDCVEMKRAAAERIYEETRGMNRAELLAFWEKRNTELRELQEAIRAKRKPRESASG